MAKASFNENVCKGCGLCVTVCPKKIVELKEHFNAKGYHPAYLTDQPSCTGCTSCALMCPDMAITVYR